jgi:hypothetical protein
MIALLVILSIVGFILVDVIHVKLSQRSKLSQTVFYNPEVGLSMADGGKEIKKK